MNLDKLIPTQPWFTEDVQLPHRPVGMLGMREAQLCYFLARDAFKGSGTIVDAGSFLGKSACFLAEGLRANPAYVSERDRIHCFDNFLVNEDGTVRFIQAYLKRTVAVGDSTREIFDSQVAPVSSMLEIHAGDFHTISWPRQPIEILLVDIAKSQSLIKRVAELFFPELIPGESLVIHQDYHHPWLPHIHVTMEYLADYFELAVPRVDDSAVFCFREAIPAHILQRAIDYDFSHEEQLALMSDAILRLPQEDRYYVQLARIVLQFGKAHEAELRDELEQLHRRFRESGVGYSANSYFEEVACSLDELEGWRCNEEAAYERCLKLADKVLRQRPSTYNMTMRGCALLGLERYPDAEEQFRAALEVRPPSGYAYIGLARALLRQDLFGEAETALLRGLRDHEAGVPSRGYLEMLTSIWYQSNSVPDKMAVVSALQRELPGDPEIWVMDALLREHRGDHEGAQGSLRMASQLGLSPERLGEVRQTMAFQAPCTSIFDPFTGLPAATSPGGHLIDPHRPWKEISHPPAVDRITSMLSPEEKQYLTWLTSEKYEGWGAIVELGVWLGSGSAAIAEGLRRQGSEATVHCFDLFRWEPYMSDLATNEDLKTGDDFLPLFLQETRDYSRWIRAQKVDLINYSWNGGPIEILLVDSAKTWEVTNAVLRGFGPHLIPGRSRVVLQDFRYHYAHCQPLIFDGRPDVWKQVEDTGDYGHTVTFMPLKPLYGPSGIDPNYSEESFPWASAEHLLRSRIAREEGLNRYRLLATLYRKQLIDGPLDEARELRAAVLAGGIGESEVKIAEDVESVLHARGWRAYQQGDFETARKSAERCLSVPLKRSAYALTLLGFSLLRLGDREGAERSIDEVLSLVPSFPSGRLFRAELAIRDGRYGEAETQALEVLKDRPSDETTIQWALNLFSQAWQMRGARECPPGPLGELAGSFEQSPNFLVYLAQEHYRAGRRPEAMKNVERALALAPDHGPAAKYRAEWSIAQHKKGSKEP